MRAAVIPAMENVALWHERDISHSSVERVIGPDTTITLDFALDRLANVVEKLIIYPRNMMKNIERFGGIHDAQRVLLHLTQKNFSREKAYTIVQRNAMKVWESFETPDNDSPSTEKREGQKLGIEGVENRLIYFLSKDSDVVEVLDEKELTELFKENSLAYHMEHVDTIFERVFGQS